MQTPNTTPETSWDTGEEALNDALGHVKILGIDPMDANMRVVEVMESGWIVKVHTDYLLSLPVPPQPSATEGAQTMVPQHISKTRDVLPAKTGPQKKLNNAKN